MSRAFDYMARQFKNRYPNQEAIAKRIGKGKTQQWVSLHLQAFETAEELKPDRSTTRVVKDRYPNQEALGKRLGKSRPWVSYRVEAYEAAEELEEEEI